MSNLHKVLLSAALALSVLAVVVASRGGDVPIVGSVGIGNEYVASSTKDYAGNTIPDLNVLQIGSGMLGSVVITGANTGTFCFYDATSTVNNTAWATSTIACFPTNAATGTYTFDSRFQKGLLLDYVTNMATATITWR
jgi:hypothetical protein